MLEHRWIGIIIAATVIVVAVTIILIKYHKNKKTHNL